MEDEPRTTKTTMLNPDEYHENSLEGSLMERNEYDRYSTNQQSKARSRAALSFMEVKSIVAASFGENERRCYKVHWKDSWIYEDHLFGCEDIIEEFWREQEKSEKQLEKMSMVAENNALSNSKKEGESDIPNNNTELTVIVVSKDTESEVSVTDEAENADQNMIPDWLIAREASDNNMKENEMEWKEDDMEVKARIVQKRRPLINVHESSEDSKENQAIWDNGDMEMKGNIVHKKRNMFTCHICGENFDMVAAIRRHYNTNHPGNKPFACDSCGKRFDRKENLNRHIRIHTGDRRYVCNHCGKGYTDPSGLKKHVLSKHSNLVFPCQFCKATFKSKDSMNRHLTKHLQDYKAQKDEGFDVGSKRTLFEDTSTGSKVFLQGDPAEMNTLDTKNIASGISEATVSDTENTSISSIQDGQENFNDSEAIEVQFIHLSQEDNLPIQSEDEKMKSTLENGQFSGPPTEHAQFVLPLTAEQILKLTTDPKNIPLIADHLKNLPITEEHLKNLPISSEQLKNIQITEEHLKNVPISTEHLKNLPITEEHFKNIPITTEHLKSIPITEEHLKNIPISTEHMKNIPITEEQLKNLPITTDHIKNIPITEEHLKNLPLVTDHLKSIGVTEEHLKNIPITEEHLKSLSITTEQIDNLPMTTDQLKSLPITSEELKSLPMTTEQFMHSNASTGQLIAVSVVSPQTFTYSCNDKLTNSLPTYSAASADINIPKD